MVRLKAGRNGKKGSGVFRISIPYGSIKRMSTLHYASGIQNFNSLWFD